MSHPIKNPYAPLTGGHTTGYTVYTVHKQNGWSPMNIIISNANDKPIYEQITTQVKNAILSGELHPGEGLPSIRALAKDLRVSVITTKRAYDELEAEGFIRTMPGKGSFVAPQNPELYREEARKQVEECLNQALEAARGAGLPPEEVRRMLELLMEEE